MREILFRGKRIDNGEWVEGIPVKTHIGTFIVFEENPHYCVQYGYMEICELAMVDPDTVGQYTGLNDKNGKRIFEGDVFEWGYCGVKEFRYVVVYDAHLAAFVGERRFGFVSLNGIDIEVIGNIHDNPELLDEVKCDG